jgi:hypothetical protein
MVVLDQKEVDLLPPLPSYLSAACDAPPTFRAPSFLPTLTGLPLPILVHIVEHTLSARRASRIHVLLWISASLRLVCRSLYEGAAGL